MDASAFETCFASPRRSPPEELWCQRDLLAEDGSLSTVLDAMPQFAMVLNGNRQIVLGNQALRDFADTHDCRDYVGMRPGEFLACQHAAGAAAGCGTSEACSTCGAVEAILAALSGRKASCECRVLRESGAGIEALDLKVWGTPFLWKGESFALVAASDISNEKRRHVLERTFFHDVLNTMSTLSSMAELLARGRLNIGEVRDELLETVQTLIGEIKGQRELLAAENNELKVSQAVLHSRSFLETVIRCYRSAPCAFGKEIVLSEGCCDTLFSSDERLLRRVLGNLLKNALEASAPGQRVTFGCTADGRTVSFWCHNEGVIPREVQLQIFLRSFSTKDPGRGIGTYSVKLFTERYLQGEVSFVSTPEGGTTFTVKYPRTPVPRSDSPSGGPGEGGDRDRMRAAAGWPHYLREC